MNTIKRGNVVFITLKKSTSHQRKEIKETIKSLKLNRIHQTTVHEDTPAIRGKIYKCRNLVSINIVKTSDIFPEGLNHLDIKDQSKKERIIDEMIEKHEDKLQKLMHQVEPVLSKYEKQ